MIKPVLQHLRGNVVAYVALFFALSASAYAAALKADSVKSKHIVDGQVKSPDVQANGLTGVDVDEATLGSVPFAEEANTANSSLNAETLDGTDSSELAKIGEWQEVGGENEPAFGVSHDCSWVDADLGVLNTAGFMREGSIVRLKGRVGINETADTSGCRDSHDGQTRTPAIFNLPPGYRPGRTELQPVMANGDMAILRVGPSGEVRYTGSYTGDDFFALSVDGIAFRCAPAGQDGCP
jgi:hypothetical protein